MVSKENNLVIKKSNKLIEARYNWDITEQRLLLLIASDIREFSGENKNIWTCRVSELEKILGIKKMSAKYLKEVCDKIGDRKIEMSDSKGNFKSYRVLQGAEYQDGELKLVLTDFIKPHLKELSGLYTQYRLKDVVHFKSQYSIRLYELLMSKNYRTNKIIISTQDLRKIFGLNEDQYDRFSNFESRVLKVAFKEVNTKSNMKIDYEKLKSGREVKNVKFTFKVTMDLEKIEDEPDLKYLKQYIPDLTDKTLRSLIQDYDKDIILEKYYIMKMQSIPVTSKAGFMRKALHEDYQLEEKIDKNEMLMVLSYAAERDRK